METIYQNNHIILINSYNDEILKIEDNQNTKNFIENWYFLNTYQNHPHYKDSFYVRYV